MNRFDSIKSLKLSVLSEFTNLIRFVNAPFAYGLFDENKWLRYSATIYGYSFDKQSCSYNLWLTLGLKRNVLVPMNFFYFPNNSRSNIWRNINSRSWFKYNFLVKDSLIFSNTTSFTKDAHLFNQLSDTCHILRSVPFLSKPLFSNSLDSDFDISNYNEEFYYYDLRARSQYFWIANQNYFKTAEFLISSFEQPLFKDPSLIDWPFWFSRLYVSFRKYGLNCISNFYASFICKDKNYIISLKLLKVLRKYILKVSDFNLYRFSYSNLRVMHLFFSKINHSFISFIFSKLVNKFNIFKLFEYKSFVDFIITSFISHLPFNSFNFPFFSFNLFNPIINVLKYEGLNFSFDLFKEKSGLFSTNHLFSELSHKIKNWRLNKLLLHVSITSKGVFKDSYFSKSFSLSRICNLLMLKRTFSFNFLSVLNYESAYNLFINLSYSKYVSNINVHFFFNNGARYFSKIKYVPSVSYRNSFKHYPFFKYSAASAKIYLDLVNSLGSITSFFFQKYFQNTILFLDMNLNNFYFLFLKFFYEYYVFVNYALNFKGLSFNLRSYPKRRINNALFLLSKSKLTVTKPFFIF